MGGIFAVQAALQKPEQVRALVLVAPSGGIDLSPFQLADWREDYQQSFTVPDWFIQHQSDLTDSLERIQCPVLLIWGDVDPISPVAVGQSLHRQIPHAELHIVSQGQHDLAYVHAEHVVQLIQNFLAKLRVSKRMPRHPFLYSEFGEKILNQLRNMLCMHINQIMLPL